MTSPTTKPTCARCGEPITPGARFCMKCGSDVSGEQGGVPTAMMPAAKDENDELLELLKQATLGDYEILRELGRGGMATVYLAHDIALDRKVALKVMSPALALMGEGMAERFKREARTAASLSHPNIIPIFAVKSYQKTLFFVMKFIAGRSLESLIKDMGPMPVEMARDLLQQVGLALGYAHRNGIVHRDVKPANIMIDEEGWSVVTDFGIAKVAENRGLTMTGIAVGTPSYMSPEQCAAKDITGKSDQYSLGVVAYEMLTGKQPFEGDSAMAIMFAHFHEAPRPIQEHRADIPDEVARTVMRMLEKTPEKRWASIEDAIGAMGAEPLAHDDPARIELVRAVRAKSNRAILDNLTPPPTSPVPPVKRPSAPDAATTPIPTARIVGVSITPTTAQLHPGETRQLIATPKVAGGTTAPTGVIWHSANPAIATVLPSGLVTAIAEGKVVITAKVDGISGTSTIEVVPVPVSAVAIEPEAPRLEVEATLTLTAKVSDSQGMELTDRKVKWSISPTGVAKISETGVLTATKAGKAEITAECEGVKGVARLEVVPIPVAAIAVTPVERVVSVGDTAALSVRLTDAAGRNLTDRTIAWSSEAPAIVAVSPRGIVTGLALGSGEVVARCEGLEARAQVRVKPVAVASLAIKQPDPLETGARVELTVTLKDARGNVLTGREVKWTSSTPSIATVTSTGQLTAVAAGTARIAAESEGKSGTVAVTVKPAPAAVTVERKQTVVPPPPVPEKAIDLIPPVVLPTPQGPPTDSGTIHFAPPVIPPKPEPKPAPAPLPDTAERPVPVPASSGKGKLIGALVGVALLAGVGYMVLRPKPESVILPSPPPPVSNLSSAVASVTIAGEDGPISLGRTRQLAALLKDAGGAELSGRVVIWTSSDPAVAEVSGVGAVTAHKAGTATITATSEGKKDEFGVVVEQGAPDQPAAVASLAMNIGSRTLDPAQTVQLNAVVKDAEGNVLSERIIVWSSADPRIATVSPGGLVTAMAPGQTVIAASSEGKTAESRISVNQPKEIPKPPVPVAVARVALIAPANPSVTVGEALRLSAQSTDGEGNTLADRAMSWKSSDEGVARVGNDGSVTGVSKGTATITATSEGKTSSVKVTVVEATVPVSAVMLSTGPRTLKVGESAPWAASARDAKGKELTDRTVTWSSSAPRVASVNGTGMITAVAVGTAEIMATSEGKTASAPITVTAPPVAVVTPPVVTPPSGGNPGTTTSPPSNSGSAALVPRKAVEAGGAFACGINGTGAVCWGTGYQGLTGISNTGGLSGLSLGKSHACGLVSGGRAVCWGDDRFGQLGDGTINNSPDNAVGVQGDLSFSEITVGSAHTCGLVSGKAYCWGRNKDGQVGDGSTSDRKKPVAVKGGKTFVALSAGGKHTCGITSSGQAFCWGDGFSGQLGFGTKESQQEPIDVSGNLKFTRIAAGGQHTCALTAAGKAYCWGGNESGQVGDGSRSDRGSPVALESKVAFEQISAGDSHSCALTASGDAYCWGENKTSQLGDGSKSNRDHPVAAGGGMSFSSISAGEGITCGMSRSQGPVCWGRNEKSQLGDGETSASGSPVVVRP